MSIQKMYLNICEFLSNESFLILLVLTSIKEIQYLWCVATLLQSVWKCLYSPVLTLEFHTVVFIYYPKVPEFFPILRMDCDITAYLMLKMSETHAGGSSRRNYMWRQKKLQLRTLRACIDALWHHIHSQNRIKFSIAWLLRGYCISASLS